MLIDVRGTLNPKVQGSIPCGGTPKARYIAGLFRAGDASALVEDGPQRSRRGERRRAAVASAASAHVIGVAPGEVRHGVAADPRAAKTLGTLQRGPPALLPLLAEPRPQPLLGLLGR